MKTAAFVVVMGLVCAPWAALGGPVADLAVFHLNEGAGISVADATGNGYGGSFVGTVGWTADSQFGKALDFTTSGGNTGYVATSLTQAQPLPLTVEAWVKTTQTSGIGGIVNKYDSGTYNGFQVFMYDGHLSGWYATKPPNRITRTDTSTDPDLVISDGNWHHTVTVFDTTGTTHYVDGGPAYHTGWSGAPGNSFETTPLRLGTYSGYRFDGLLDEVAIYNRALTADEAAERFANGPPRPPAPPPADAIILNFNEGSGSPTADGIPFNHSAQLNNGAQWTASGKFGSAVNLQGNDGYVETTLTDAVAPPLTLEGWIKTTNTASSESGIINKYASGSMQGFQTFVRDGNLSAWYYDGGTRARIDEAAFVADGEWHHHAAVWDASGLELYLDGRSIATTGWTSGVGSSSETTPLRVGAYPNSAGTPASFFNGVVDGVALHRTALSADQVAARYGDGPPVPAQPVTNLICLNLDEGAGTTTRDLVSGQPATLYSQGIPSDAPWTPDGKFGPGVCLDSTKQQYVETQLTAPQPVPLTLEAWIKTADTRSTHVGIINKYGSGSYEGFQIFYDLGNLSAWYYTDTTHAVALTGQPINDDEWHHVAAIFDENGVRAFLDGYRVGSGAWSAGVGTSVETTPLRLGTYPDINGVPNIFFDGYIDEAALYRRALTEDEIMARYLDGAPTVPEPATMCLLGLGLGLLARRRRR